MPELHPTSFFQWFTCVGGNRNSKLREACFFLHKKCRYFHHHHPKKIPVTQFLLLLLYIFRSPWSILYGRGAALKKKNFHLSEKNILLHHILTAALIFFFFFLEARGGGVEREEGEKKNLSRPEFIKVQSSTFYGQGKNGVLHTHRVFPHNLINFYTRG